MSTRPVLVDAAYAASTVTWVNTSALRISLSFAGALIAAVPVIAGIAASPSYAAEPTPTFSEAPINAVQDGSSRNLSGPAPVSAWPLPDSSLWVPPRQGLLAFAKPVDASTFILTLETADGAASQLTRLTKGTSRDVVFGFPILTGPADLTLNYVGVDSVGNRVSGSIEFDLEIPFATSGGGNHRHASDAVHTDEPDLVVLRALFVWAAALAMLSAWRSRRGRRSFSELLLPRVAGLLLAVGSLWQAARLLSGQIDAYPDSPLMAVVSSAGLWLFLPLAAAGLLQVIAGRRDTAVAVVSTVALFSVVASTGHASGSWGALQAVGYSLLLLSAAALGAALVELGSRLWTSAAGRATPLAVKVLFLSALALSLSFAMVVLHAHGLTLNGDFLKDVLSRATAGAVLLAATAGTLVVSFRPVGVTTRIAAIPLLVAAGVAMTYLLWLPPPTSGL